MLNRDLNLNRKGNTLTTQSEHSHLCNRKIVQIILGPTVEHSSLSLIVLTPDGNLEIGAHVWSALGYLIYLRHLIGSRAVTEIIFILRKVFVIRAF